MNLYNRRKLIAVPLLITGLLILSGFYSAEAALLKDIRIGEYKGFTRIVFELNAPGRPPQIQPQSNGVLTAGFDGVQPDLKRKIPVERSEHVRELKFWYRDNRLSIILQFDFDHFRFETFPLEKPPRIVLDIHPLTAKPVADDEAMSQKSEGAGAVHDMPVDQSAVGTTKSINPSTEAESRKMNPNSTIAWSEHSPAISADNKEPSRQQVASKTPTPVPTATSAPRAPGGSDIDRPRPKSNRLQFYLVITLVVITIVILALLLLTLLARHRWAGDKYVANVNESLKNQDQHIASLNARIKEQFKRYDEA